MLLFAGHFQILETAYVTRDVNPNESLMTTIHREHIEWCDTWIRSAEATRHPRALLIGDSICRGYYQAVEQRLDGEIDCARVATSRFVLDPTYQRELALTIDQCRFSLIHFNNGLHGWDFSEADYADGLNLLVDFLRRRAPQATLIWAASTPVYQANELTQHAPNHVRVVERNRLARAVMVAQGIAINDLFSLALGKTAWFCEDGVHFNEEGNKFLSEQVAGQIRSGLKR